MKVSIDGVVHDIKEEYRHKQSPEFYKALEDGDGYKAMMLRIPATQRSFNSIMMEVDQLRLNATLKRTLEEDDPNIIEQDIKNDFRPIRDFKFWNNDT